MSTARLATKRTTSTVYGGDRTSVIAPSGGTNTTSIVDSRGNTTKLSEFTTSALSGGVPSGTSQDTLYTHDTLGRLTTMTDPKNAAWTYSYDLAGRQITQTDPDAGTTTSSYLDTGETATSKDARNTTLSYGYDTLGRKTSLTSGGTTLASWLYDTLQPGKLTSSTRNTADGAYVVAAVGYDANGRSTGTKVTVPSGEPNLTGSYTTGTAWTTTGLPNTVSIPATPGLSAETLAYTYSRLGNPIATWGMNAYSSGTTYNPYGEVAQISLGVNNLSGWLTITRDVNTDQTTGMNLAVQTATPQVDDYAYTYNTVGDLTKTVNTQGGGTSPPVETTCYTYDTLRQLTQAWSATDACAHNPAVSGNGTVNGPQPWWTTWTIDPAGNRTSQAIHATAGHPAAATTTNYTYTTPGHAHAVTNTTGGTTGSYTYDPAGNLLTRTQTGGNLTLTYDPYGKTGTATNGSTTSTYIYDADGNQLLRKDTTGTATTKTLYLPYGQEVVYFSAYNTASTRRYYSQNGYTLAMRAGPGNYGYLIQDVAGTSQTMATISGSTFTTPTRRHTDPYGNQLGTSTWNTGIDQHGFLNQPQTAVGIADIGARKYDPSIGKFLSVDPILTPYGPRQNNGYTYGGNNPNTHPDPTGNCYQDYSTGEYVGVGCGGSLPDGGHNYTSWTNEYQDNNGDWKTNTDPNTSQSNPGAYESGTIEATSGPNTNTRPSSTSDNGSSDSGRNDCSNLLTTNMLCGRPILGICDQNCQRTQEITSVATQISLFLITFPEGGEGGFIEIGGATAAKDFADAAAAKTTTDALSYSAKLTKQMGPRGWTEDSISATVRNPETTHPVWDYTSGDKLPATAYVQRGGGYVVVNDSSGEIVQVSDLGNPNWKPVWDDPRFQR